MRILVYRWRAYNYRDIEQAFLRMGHEVDVIEQKLEHYDEDSEFEQTLSNRIKKTRPDMVFTVNYFALISNVCMREGTRYVVWTCDNPLISMYHESVFNSCNYIFTFDKVNCLEFAAMGVSHIWHLPLAADASRMDAVIGGATDMERYGDDVSFVGSLYERNSYDRLRPHLPEYLRGYFDAAIEAQLNLSGASILEPLLTPDVLGQLEEYFHLEKSDGSFSDLGLIFQTTVLGFKIAQEQRRRALIELSKRFRVSVYSNSDVSGLIGIRSCGSVDYWSELPKVFRASKVNLNMTIPNIKSGIPLRVWDVLAAGGFLLTNYQAEIPMYFEDGKDLVCFDGPEDLAEKVGYYLAHDGEREEIARRGQKKVREGHSYDIRIREMMRIIGEN